MSTDMVKAADESAIEFIPVGESSPIKLTIAWTRKFLCTPTRSGKQPSDAEVVKFMMLCKSRGLNPWVGDAYLVGYDGKDGPQFSLITAHQAILKRAELSPEFDGIESGVVIGKKDSDIDFRQGDMLLPGETLLGGWARCYRKDRSKPFYDSLNRHVYDTGRSQWSKDPAGMIVKCAEASVLRKAFPSMNSGLYTAGEMETIDRVAVATVQQDKPQQRLGMTLDDLVPDPKVHQAVVAVQVGEDDDEVDVMEGEAT